MARVVAIAASTALPPAWRISRPAAVASGWAELTIARLLVAGRGKAAIAVGPIVSTRLIPKLIRQRVVLDRRIIVSRFRGNLQGSSRFTKTI
jgi:hypothetical protein